MITLTDDETCCILHFIWHITFKRASHFIL